MRNIEQVSGSTMDVGGDLCAMLNDDRYFSSVGAMKAIDAAFMKFMSALCNFNQKAMDVVASEMADRDTEIACLQFDRECALAEC